MVALRITTLHESSHRVCINVYLCTGTGYDDCPSLLSRDMNGSHAILAEVASGPWLQLQPVG